AAAGAARGARGPAPVALRGTAGRSRSLPQGRQRRRLQRRTHRNRRGSGRWRPADRRDHRRTGRGRTTGDTLMAMNVGGSKSGPSSDINMTPMIDILLVLLIIFMVVQQGLQKGLSLQVPPMEES